MIRVTVELVSARTGETTRLGDALIFNEGSGTPTRGTYGAVFRLKRLRPWRTSRVMDFPRQSKNVWYLIYRALKIALDA
jgi:hypothetical protein